MNKTAIEYLSHTWSPVAMRCDRVSPGCDNCWALRMSKRHAANPSIGKELREARGGGPCALLEDELAAPLKLRKPARIGVQLMGDLFHDQVHDEWVHLVIALASMAPWHTFMLLTKRPGRARRLLAGDEALENLEAAHSMAMEKYGHHVFDVHARRRDDGRATAWMFAEDGLPPNLWLGVSVENQETADERIPILLDTPAAARWVSAEPMLEAVDLSPHLWPTCWAWDAGYGSPEAALAAGAEAERRPQALVAAGANYLRWAVCGSEQGPGKRPMDLGWARDLRDQCAAAGVPFYFKKASDGTVPDDLNVREFPG